MSIALRDGVSRLEVTTRVTLGVLALASGVYTYLGVRDLLNGDATVVFFAAVIYSVAVSVGIYAFWTFLIRFLPHVQDKTSRGLLFACMGLGSLMIIAMSAWLNASALAGAAAIQQHLSVTVQAYTRDLDRAHNNALAAQSLLPDIQMAATRFSTLADAERNGSPTGSLGRARGQARRRRAGLGFHCAGGRRARRPGGTPDDRSRQSRNGGGGAGG